MWATRGQHVEIFLDPTLAAAPPLPLAGPEGAAYPFCSPDSAHIAFLADGKVKKVSLAVSGGRNLCEAPGLATR